MESPSFCGRFEKNNFLLGTAPPEKLSETPARNKDLNSAQERHTLSVLKTSTCRATEVECVSLADRVL
jgi:hypothetical protein